MSHNPDDFLKVTKVRGGAILLDGFHLRNTRLVIKNLRGDRYSRVLKLFSEASFSRMFYEEYFAGT